MIKYDDEYYKKIIKKYKYKKINEFLSIDKKDLKNKWFCSYNLDSFIEGVKLNEKSLVIMGIGINDIPHLGTISQIMRAIFLQKQGLTVQIILGDLDVYGARSKSLEEINKLLDNYKRFIISLGFDIDKGIIRNQYDHDNIIKTSFLLSSVITDKDFIEIEEDINNLYKEEQVYCGMNFNVKQAISLMFADFIHPGYIDEYKHVLIMSGIDEHGYVWKADEIKNKMGINMTISGLYSKMLKGLNQYPKMSKSLSNSTINPKTSYDEIKNIILNNQTIDDFIFEMMLNVSNYDSLKISKINKNYKLKNEFWELDKINYVDDLYSICQKWNG